MEPSQQVIKIGWPAIDAYCQQLYQKINERKFAPDVIVTPLRGGAVPAVILSHKLGVRDIITAQAKRTESDAINAAKHTVTVDFHTTKDAIKGKNILLVDEIVDTGETIQKVYQKLQEMKPKQILSVCIFKQKAPAEVVFTPDIYLQENNAWVVFPWET
jgi:uncharacterized protein